MCSNLIEKSLENIKFSNGEVIDAKYVTINEFNNMIKNGETHEWLEYFNELYKKLYKNMNEKYQKENVI